MKVPKEELGRQPEEMGFLPVWWELAEKTQCVEQHDLFPATNSTQVLKSVFKREASNERVISVVFNRC